MKKANDLYEEKIKRDSRLRYLHRKSDFIHLNVVEFEEWKAELNLYDEELSCYRQRRSELKRMSESYLEAYRLELVSLDGKKGLLSFLKENFNSHDCALFGQIIFQALNLSPKKGQGPSVQNSELKRQIQFFLQFLRNEKFIEDPPFAFKSQIKEGKKIINYPGKNKTERISLIYERYNRLGFKSLISSKEAVKELSRTRLPRKR